MRDLPRLAARLAAGLLVVAVMAGPVIAVASAAGNPFPADLLDRLATRSLDDATIVKLLSLGFYICWAWFCAPALRQVWAALGSPRRGRLRPATSARTGVGPSRTVEPTGRRTARLARRAGPLRRHRRHRRIQRRPGVASRLGDGVDADRDDWWRRRLRRQRRDPGAGFDGRGDVGGGVASGHAVRAGTALLPAGTGRRRPRRDRRAERRSADAGRHALPGRRLPGGLDRGHPRHPRRQRTWRTGHLTAGAVAATSGVIDTAGRLPHPTPTVATRSSPSTRRGTRR